MTRKRTTENDLHNSQAAPVRRKTTARTHPNRPAAPTETQAAEPRQAEPGAGQQPAPSAPTAEPSREAIARLAYSYWQERGFAGGSEQEDWLRAERQLKRGLGIRD